ncbi:(2Fe-2S)-binding protein [Epibacterium sp. SM1969]|uniref:(2Fe-2S)-binding protein n=1 Tax=Tritonibacter aquimaris TaxID=2663379 RepID=A0A844AKF2_9RHOB|nr:(2Fe-2S)-binding protein [Tritonibacter aquimaris]MQY41589.1 (2Fe-2S)-binding protein [Tritonibacter aquimaris]
MIVCSCQSISSSDINSAISWMRTSDPETIITPGKIYRALGKSPDCGGCMKLFVATMRKSDKFEVPAILRGMNETLSQEKGHHEGRQESHRISQ